MVFIFNSININDPSKEVKTKNYWIKNVKISEKNRYGHSHMDEWEGITSYEV